MEQGNKPNYAGQMKKILANYYAGIKQVEDGQRQLVAWCSGIAPVEILYALNIIPVFPENHAVMVGANHMGAALCDAANSEGYQDICSYALIDFGCMAAGNNTGSVDPLPKPDLLFACNNTCATITKWYEALGRHFNVPVILIDTPFMSAQSTPEQIRYTTNQLYETITFLSQHFSLKFDLDLFKETVRNTTLCTQGFKKAQQYAVYRPSPFVGFEGHIHLAPSVVMRGTKEAITYYDLLNLDLDSRVKSGLAGVPGEEHRFFWDGLPFWFKLREVAAVLKELKISVVASNSVSSWALEMAADNPFQTMAETYTALWINQNLENKAEYIKQCINEFGIDGVIYRLNLGCKSDSFGRFDLKNMIQRDTGVSGVIIDGEHTDPRKFSLEQLRTRLAAFTESLYAAKN